MSTQDKQHRNNNSLTRTLCSRANKKRHGVISDAVQDTGMQGYARVCKGMQGLLASGSSIHTHTEIISTYVSNPYYMFNSMLRLIYSTNNIVYC